MSTDKINLTIVGIPICKELESPQILEFFNQPKKTICCFDGPPKNSFGGYNFFDSHEFVLKSRNQFYSEELSGSKNVFKIDTNLWKLNNNTTIFSTPKSRLKNLETYLIQLHEDFSDCRLVLAFFGNPFLHCSAPFIDLNTELFDIEIISTDTFVEKELNNFFELSSLLTEYSQNPCFKKYITDRSKIFFPEIKVLFPTSNIFSDLSLFPEDLYTDKSFSEIMDIAVTEWEFQNPVIAWSGGIDSTAVLAAFYKKNIKCSVLISENSKQENLELYEFVVKNFDTIYLPDDVNLCDIIDSSRLVVTGEGCDQLFPPLIHDLGSNSEKFKYAVTLTNFDEYEEYFNTELQTEYFKQDIQQIFVDKYSKYFNCSLEKAQEYYLSYIIPIMEKFPIKINYFYQLVWFFDFVFRFDYNTKQKYPLELHINNSIAFFVHEDFQRWALTNLDYNFDTYSTNYKIYKSPVKQYAYDVFKIDSILEKTKWPSKII